MEFLAIYIYTVLSNLSTWSGVMGIEDKPSKPNYPYVGQSKSGTKVLFVGPSRGYIVSCRDESRIGNYHRDWFEQLFTPITYTITFDLS